MRVLIAAGGTGGHLYPGLAIARALVRLHPAAEPFFVGALRGIERDILPRTEFPHALLDLHPLYRSAPWKNWRTVVGMARAWLGIGAIIRQRRPVVALGCGGYTSGGTLSYAIAHRIPTALQEQNSYPGLTVRLFSRWARAIYLGYAEAAAWLPARARRRAVETGNPIEPPPWPRPDRAAARAVWGFPASSGRVLLVFGGSQGARAINEAVDSWIGRGLPGDLHLIWGTGKTAYDRFARRESDSVRVLPYLSPIQDAYAAADLAITRAGALTLAELCAWGIPSVLVPLPTAAADHQTANARALSDAGAALLLPQAELSAERAHTLIGSLLAAPDRLPAMAAAALARARPNAAEDIARRLLTLAEATRAPP